MLDLLPGKAQRGSKPRCHWLTHGAPEHIAGRLTMLVAPWASVAPGDSWMPQGFEVLEEAQLHKAPRLLDPEVSRQLADWWLPAGQPNSLTPNFDIAASCSVQGRAGLMLVEAKAHDLELINESAGRRLGSDASQEREASHKTIETAINDAAEGLTIATGHKWRLSRDSHYQMSNRFAWAWKLADLGIPVVLVYLGFLSADEMKDRGNPFSCADEWDVLVKAHSAPLFPSEVWNQCWSVNGVPLIPLTISVRQPLHPALAG